MKSPNFQKRNPTGSTVGAFFLSRTALTATLALLVVACSKRPDRALDAAKPVLHSIERTGRLQRGISWTVVASFGEPAATSRNLVAKIGGHAVDFPADALDGIPAWDDALVVQFAEASGDPVLLLTNGGQPSGWDAKFVIRDNRVVERELSISKGEPTLIRYPAAAVLQYGTIPPEELEKHRKKFSSPQTNNQTPNP